MIWPFGDLQPGAYNMIVADPPWRFLLRSAKGGKKSPQAHYVCRDLDWVKALPVARLAQEHAFLFLWTTSPMLPQAVAVLDAWGFRYVTQGQWIKQTRHGRVAFGTGFRVRSSSEPWLLATVGKPRLADHSRSHRNVIFGLRREHSRKPEESYHWCETYLPGARRCELFATAYRQGWDVWGDQLGKHEAGEGCSRPRRSQRYPL